MYRFLPEGRMYENDADGAPKFSCDSIEKAMRDGRMLESKALVCDSAHNLVVDLGCMKGVIPREEGAKGIREGAVRDIAIISRVGKPVCFVVKKIISDSRGMPCAILSRRAAQERCCEEYVSKLACGDVIDARVTHLEPFGAFVDIGCGLPSLISIDAISVSRIAHPRDRLSVGMDIRAVVRSVETDGRISLSHRELLGTWQQNAAKYRTGETVAGIVRSVEEYGIFVELTPNLAGLAEYRESVTVGSGASVYIKSIVPERMKIKLVLVDTFRISSPPPRPEYFFSGDHMNRFVYSPPTSDKIIETVFVP